MELLLTKNICPDGITPNSGLTGLSILYIYIYICVCVCIYFYTNIFLSIFIYEVYMISFQTFFVWALLLIVHTWNSNPLQTNLLWLQCTCTVPTISGIPQWSPLVWLCRWPSSQPLSSLLLSHNNSLWA